MEFNLIILGSGESGTGAALLAKQRGISVFVSDRGLIPEKYKIELQQHHIPFEEGQHSEDLILDAQQIIKSPGIAEKADIMKKIRAKGISVISEIEFAFRYKGESKILCITGSNGKTTTTSLAYYIFEKAGYDVSVVGNIGNSFARQIVVKPTEWYVMEISSFQLDDIQSFRPDIAVIMNITPDHLDRYNYDFAKYTQAKFNITKHQEEDDYLILCKDDKTIQQFLHDNPINSKTLFFTMNEQLKGDGAFLNQNELVIKVNGEPFSISINELSLKGKHNQYNTMAACVAAATLTIRKDKIRDAVQHFEQLEHRMEFVATVRGVEFINDSKATNINSTWYALESMTKPTVLILGGVDKGNDYSLLLEGVKEKVKAIICLGVDTKKIHEAFDGVVPTLIDTQDAAEAVQLAFRLAGKGDAVLLSPACASFDLFKNYEDRGQQFKNAVRDL